AHCWQVYQKTSQPRTSSDSLSRIVLIGGSVSCSLLICSIYSGVRSSMAPILHFLPHSLLSGHPLFFRLNPALAKLCSHFTRRCTSFVMCVNRRIASVCSHSRVVALYREPIKLVGHHRERVYLAGQ